MRIHWFSVDERPVREKKIFSLKNIRIHRLDVIILACVQTLPTPQEKSIVPERGGGEGGLYKGKIICEGSIKASTRVSQEVDR